MEFDGLLAAAGDNGLYQMALFSLAGLMTFVAVDPFAINFLAGHLDHWCRVEPLDAVLAPELQRRVAIPRVTALTGVTRYSSCEYYAGNYSAYSSANGEELYSANWSAASEHNETRDRAKCSAWVYDRSGVFASSIQSEWDLVCDRRWLIDLVSAIYMLGRLVACMISGPISDRFGRKPTILGFHAVKLVGSVLSLYAPSYWLYVTSRFVIALGSTASTLSFFFLLSETIGEKYRHIYCIGWNALIAVGGMCLAGVAYFVRDYRSLQAIYTWPQFAIFIAVFILDESPRWLMARGRTKEAVHILRKICTVNRRPPLVVTDLTPPPAEEVRRAKQGSIKDLVRTPNIRRKTFILWLNWFTDALMYYSLSLNTGRLPGDIFLNTFLLMAVELPANLLTGFLLGRVGRRLTLALFTGFAGLAGFLMIPFMFAAGLEVVVTVFAMLGKACITVAYSSVYVVTAEIYPKCVRGIGLGTSASFARLSGMGASFVGGLLNDMWRPLPSIIFGVLGFVSGGFVFLLPETRGQKLPDTIQDAELFGKKPRRWPPGEPCSPLKTDASEELLEKGCSSECHQLQNSNLQHENEPCNDVSTKDKPCNDITTKV